ncbi:MAG TPA: lamin tail domain-containing protein [Chitinophagaceae bacterium]|nr:lamin tail domain-containing protein [Chitinophagaceae bacterium]HPH30532.1 lamin tail domain-containing protein [Chitinophagaceae bacterium]
MKRTLSLLISILLLTPVCMWSQNRFDVIISELMPDPSPTVGLPASEWIELKNCSSQPVSLQNWRITDANGQSGPLPSFVLQPDSFLIICSSSALAAMSQSGTAIAVSSFPSLDNEGEWIALKAPDGRVIHSVNYTSNWYGNALKQEGGWSLEMIDTRNPCSGKSNWTASIHPAGGSPGKKNSTEASNPDTTAPRLLRSYSQDSVTIRLVFDEPLDSATAVSSSQYSISQGITISSVSTVTPLFQEVQLKLNSPLQHNLVYTVKADGISDCKGNRLTVTETKAGRAQDPVPGQIVVNEILFNPAPNGEDYVEIYNHSNQVADLSRLFMGNRNSSGSVSSIKALSSVPFYLYPGEYLAFTESPDQLPLFFMVRFPDRVLAITSPPSFPDEEGTVLLLNGQGVVIDEVKYNKDWHFKLISNDEGVALERLDPGRASGDPGNWHSAATTAGYGTPGYQNSQYRSADMGAGQIKVSPAVFSPDNDGRDDLALIQYSLEESGYVANLVIFDAEGKPVKQLVRNALLGRTGSWTWDGLDDSRRSLPLGHYIVMAELFNLQGKKQQYKQVIVLARRLN